METNTYMPTQEQFDVVINNFKKIQEICKDTPVNMMDGEIHDCGSPMCHGGWYAWINKDRLSGNYLDYSDGSQLMAEDLGFKYESYLNLWAESNPKIWGNKKGRNMFCSSSAFSKTGKTVESISTILKHWEGVKVRALKFGSK
jgi:hypothetical protein